MKALFAYLFSLSFVFQAVGAVLWVIAWNSLTNRRKALGSAAYWFLLGGTFLFGDYFGKVIPYWVAGTVVVVLVAIEAGGWLVSDPVSSATDPNNSLSDAISLPGARIFLPVLALPVTTFLFAAVFRLVGKDTSTGALVGLGFGGLLAAGLAVRITGSTVAGLIHAGRKATQDVGALAVLPQLLAALGALFTAAGVGDTLAGLLKPIAPQGSPWLAGLVYFLAMALFTMVMGNSFAAFSVITTGIGIPLLIAPYNLDPTFIGILGLTAGSCGTLSTPMAANFNLLPASLYAMRDEFGVIRFQWKFALALWLVHLVVLAVWLAWGK